MKDAHRYDDVYPWHERQCEQCGYTPKCCSCKWCRKYPPEVAAQAEKAGLETWGLCVNPVQNKGLSAKAHAVDWRGTCFNFEWMHDDGQLEMNLGE